MIDVIELCTTLHGEWPQPGKPCVLIRFKYCNLTCSYCDADLDKEPLTVDYEQVVDLIRNSGLDSVLVTGGEPTLNLGAKKLMSDPRLKHVTFVLETNGTVPLSSWHPFKYNWSIAMDWKLDLEEDPTTIKNLDYLRSGDVLKFVFWDKPSFIRACEVIDIHIGRGYHSYKIIFSPTDPRLVKEIEQEFILFTSTHETDIRLQQQLHKIWGVV